MSSNTFITQNALFKENIFMFAGNNIAWPGGPIKASWMYREKLKAINNIIYRYMRSITQWEIPIAVINRLRWWMDRDLRIRGLIPFLVHLRLKFCPIDPYFKNVKRDLLFVLNIKMQYSDIVMWWINFWTSGTVNFAG